MVNIAGEIELTAKASGSASNNSIFRDSSDNLIKFKDNSGNINIIDTGMLGEVKQFALSVSGSLSKATLQGLGWAICDGTDIVATQGITGATITGNAPDLQHTFLRMSDDESSGGTGGSETHNHSIAFSDPPAHNVDHTNVTSALATSSASTLPTYYELAFFIKVK